MGYFEFLGLDGFIEWRSILDIGCWSILILGVYDSIGVALEEQPYSISDIRHKTIILLIMGRL